MLSTNVYTLLLGTSPKIHYSSFCSSLHMERKPLCFGLLCQFQKNYNILSLGFPGCHKPPKSDKQWFITLPHSLSIPLNFFCVSAGSQARLIRPKRVNLSIKRNGCRVHVKHWGQGIKWEEAERYGVVNETKLSITMKIIIAAVILMDPILCLCHLIVLFSISPAHIVFNKEKKRNEPEGITILLSLSLGNQITNEEKVNSC